MILNSKINDKKYLWVKVPRTASTFYTLNFFPDLYVGNSENYSLTRDHLHEPYKNMVSKYGSHPGITIVRNPHDRFVSSLRYMKQKSIEHNHIAYSMSIPTDSIEVLCNFLEKNFNRDCITTNSLEQIFNKQDISFTRSFFITQTEFAYHPKVNIFKYENLSEFDEWLNKELGISIQNDRPKNYTKKDILSHLNFEDEQFVRIIENMFYTDYKVFNYKLKYLK